MAVSSSLIWELRPASGSDLNGGGFKQGATGTDRSQQNSAQVTVDGATISAVVHTTTTQLVLTGYTVSAADVGNIFFLNGGTATTKRRYEITAVDIPNNRWTLDGTIGTAAQTATGKMGGALATTAELLGSNTVPTAGNKCFVTGTEVVGSAITWNRTIEFEGYSSVRGDGGKYTWQHSAAFGLITLSAECRLTNVKFDGNGTASTVRPATSATQWYLDNWEVTGYAGTGNLIDFRGHSTGGYIHDNSTTGVLLGNGDSATHLNLVVRNNPNCSFAVLSSTKFSLCNFIIANNGGVGIYFSNNVVSVRNGVVYASGSHGLQFFWSAGNLGGSIENVIAMNNGGYGFNIANSYPMRLIGFKNCYSKSNTSGAQINVVDTITALAGDPFTSAATGDFSLNNTAGAGAVLRGTGWPASYAGLTASYGDVGAAQHQDSGGGTTTIEVNTVLANVGYGRNAVGY